MKTKRIPTEWETINGFFDRLGAFKCKPAKLAPPREPTPQEKHWASLSSDERSKYRKNFDWSGPFETVSEYAFADKFNSGDDR